MRKNQISINICRYNDQVPQGYPEQRQIINVYSDSNNLFEALSSAYAKAVDTVAEWQRVAVRTDIVTNADGTMSGNILGRTYSEDIQLEYLDERLKMNRDLLYYIEHSEEILSVIKNSDDKAAVRKNLEEHFGFTQQQIASILRIRFDMFTREEIEDIKADIAKMEEVIKNREERNKNQF